jgi:hypothetical protein
MVRKSQLERRPIPLHAQLVSISVASAQFDVHPATIRRRIASGQLIGYKLGPRVLRVDLTELEKLFQPTTTTKGRTAS